MKQVLLLLLIGVSCSPKFRPDQERVGRSYYVAIKTTDWYEKPDSTSRRLMPLLPGDTISTLQEPIQRQGWQAVERKGTLGFLRDHSLLPVQLKNAKPKSGDSLLAQSIGNSPTHHISAPISKPPVSTRYSTPTTGAAIYTSPDGGKYYNRKGNKTYIRRQ